MKRKFRHTNFNWKIITAVCLVLVMAVYVWRSFNSDTLLNGFVRRAAGNFTVKYSNATRNDESFVENVVGFGAGTISEIFSGEKVSVSGEDDSWYDDSLMARGEYIQNNVSEKNEDDSTEKETVDNEKTTNQEEITNQEESTDDSTGEKNNVDDNENETIGEGAEADANISKNIYVQMPDSIGKKYTLEDLGSSNYIISKFFTVPSSTKLLSKDVEINSVMSYDATIKQDSSKPQILIYHTHSMEGYTDSDSGDTSTGIVGVGEYLAKILTEQFGYNVIHCTESFDVNDKGYVDRANAYKRARVRLLEILEENPTIEVILDVHRDGVDENLKFVTEVNGKKTAKVMFFNGLCRDSKGNPYGSSEYREENLALSLQMKLLAEEYYPNYTRKNYVNAYHYNMNLREKSMLIEVGAQTNTLSEAKNAMEPLAVLLNKVLN